MNWFATDIAEAFFNRLEFSYGYENVNIESALSFTKHNIGAKILLVSENRHDLKFLPAVSVGGIYKHTDNTKDATLAPGAHKDGWDA